MSAPRKLVRKAAAAEKSSRIEKIYYQHADGTVDENDAPDVIGGVIYPKNPGSAPVHFTRPSTQD